MSMSLTSPHDRSTGDLIAEAFAGKRVFVTGHTGFKGSWLCHWLHRLGASIYGYALEPPTEPNNFTLSEIRPLLTGHTIADIRDADKLGDAIRAAQPDVILHLAAQPLVLLGYQEPHETIDVNVMGTSRLLDQVRRIGKPCSVVVITSDKCYENREQIWGYRECDRMGGFDPYSVSKGIAELVVDSYRRSYFDPSRYADHGVKLASVRAGNVIGGGDWSADHLIVDIIDALQAGEPIPVRNPQSVRPWQHVLEPISGYLIVAANLLLSDDPQYCSGWNFGPVPGDDLPVQQLVEQFIDCWGKGEWQLLDDEQTYHEDQILRINIEKAWWRLNWRPRWNVRQTVEKTVEWYKAYHQDPTTMRDVTIRQIEEYESANPLGPHAVAAD